MASPRRFLFLYSHTGGGHLATARAVADAMQARYGDAAEIDLVDIFVASGIWPFNHFPDWYPAMLGLGSWPWRAAYHTTDSAAAVSILSRLFWPYACSRLIQLMANHPADAIVSFHPIPNGILARYRALAAPTTPLAVVVQDFLTAPAAWFAPGPDAWFLPWQETADRALALGLPADRLHITGMPVRRAFLDATTMAQTDARALVGLDTESPVVLFVGGGDGAGDMFPFVQALMARDPAAQVVVIAGRNQALRQRLQNDCAAPNLLVLDYQENMPQWMRAADILVTKAGPNTLAEAFVMGLPSVIYHAIPGQESGNPKLVAAHGAGVWAPRPDLAADAVMQLLADENERRKMAAAARALSRPDAADAIARGLWALVEE